MVWVSDFRDRTCLDPSETSPALSSLEQTLLRWLYNYCVLVILLEQVVHKFVESTVTEGYTVDTDTDFGSRMPNTG